jgi:hypothetical protein
MIFLVTFEKLLRLLVTLQKCVKEGLLKTDEVIRAMEAVKLKELTTDDDERILSADAEPEQIQEEAARSAEEAEPEQMQEEAQAKQTRVTEMTNWVPTAAARQVTAEKA